MKRSSSSETPAAPSSLQCHQRLADRVAERIHQHVDMPKGGKDRIDRAPDLVRLRDVGDDGDHTPSGRRRDLRRRPLDVFGCQGIERDIGPGLGEDLGNSFADAASGPADEDDFPRNIEFDGHHGVFSLMMAQAWTGS